MSMPELRCAMSRTRSGFTLIELIAVVIIIGIISVLAISKFGNSKRRAYLAAMKSDLHNIGLVAETRFATENTYATMVAPQGSAGVTLTFEGTANDWVATATHVGLPDLVCDVRSGGGANAEPVCR
jgi:prepilin-type N-terminal cleavage/methylation domain-containing protein